MAARKQSFIATPGLEVQYEGSKSFWKTRTNLDILIVSHPRNNCLEIVGYDANKGLEARAYVNALLLSTKLDQADIKAKVEEKKEANLRQKKAANAAQIQKEIVVNAMNQYLTSRLQLDEASEVLKILLSPMTGDAVNNDTKQLDIVMDIPSNLVPLPTCFIKKATANDIRSALNQLEVESLELKRATRLAELALTSVDGFKAMLAEKMKLESEMKRKFTVARLRWIKAINRVLVQNYVAKVKIRLGLVTPEPPASPIATERRPKIFRRSIDNAYLDTDRSNAGGSHHKSMSALPNLVGKPSPINIHAGAPSGGHSSVTPSHLPALSPSNQDGGPGMSEKRRRRTQRTKDGKYLTRKSYETLPSPEHKLTLACPSNDSVPSLLESWTSMSTKVVPQVTVPVIVDIREHSTRALRLAKL